MSLAGCQINPIDVNFHLKKLLEIFDKKSVAKKLMQKGQVVGTASCQLGLSGILFCTGMPESLKIFGK